MKNRLYLFLNRSELQSLENMTYRVGENLKEVELLAG